MHAHTEVEEACKNNREEGGVQCAQPPVATRKV